LNHIEHPGFYFYRFGLTSKSLFGSMFENRIRFIGSQSQCQLVSRVSCPPLCGFEAQSEDVSAGMRAVHSQSLSQVFDRDVFFFFHYFFPPNNDQIGPHKMRNINYQSV